MTRKSPTLTYVPDIILKGCVIPRARLDVHLCKRVCKPMKLHLQLQGGMQGSGQKGKERGRKQFEHHRPPSTSVIGVESHHRPCNAPRCY